MSPDYEGGQHPLAFIIDSFRISDEKINSIIADFKDELDSCIRTGNKRMLKCLPSFVESLPKGTEAGEFVVIDLGGTNLRVGLCTLQGCHQFEQQHDTFEVPDAIKSGSGHKLFDFIAEKVLAFVSNLPLKPYDVGFTFSFPVEQNGLSHGKLIQFNKAYDCHDIVGHDVVQLLQERFDKLLPGRLTIRSLVNDTVGTFVAHGYINPSTRMGVILGTGTNAAYFDTLNGTRMIINIEWGGFGDSVSVDKNSLPLTPVDVEIDAESENKGRQTFEKMVSGMYLGEQFRRCALDFLTLGYETPYSLDTKYLTDIELVLKNGLAAGTVQMLNQLALTILERSAKLAAALITAVYQRARDSSPFVAAIDGSLYTKNPTYKEMISKAVQQYTQSDELVIEASKGEPLVGSGIVIAAAK